jgi:hypothetical protein
MIPNGLYDRSIPKGFISGDSFSSIATQNEVQREVPPRRDEDYLSPLLQTMIRSHQSMPAIVRMSISPLHQIYEEGPGDRVLIRVTLDDS